MSDSTKYLRKLYAMAQRLAARASVCDSSGRRKYPGAAGALALIQNAIAAAENYRAQDWLAGAERPSRQRPIIFGPEVGITERPSVQPPAF
jgi:hypothetical protein